MVTLTEDIPPEGAECTVPFGFIVMDENDLMHGRESKRWLPFPAAVCESDGFTRESESGYALLSFPIALLAALVAGWAAGRDREPVPETWDYEEA